MSWLSHVIKNIVHTVEDVGKGAGHIVKDTLDLAKKLLHEVNRETFDVVNFELNVVDVGFKELGVKGSVSFLEHLSAGLEHIISADIDGDPEAIAMTIVIAASVASGVGAASSASMWGTAASDWVEILAGGEASAMTAEEIAYTSYIIAENVAFTVSSFYGVYATADSVAELGKQIELNGKNAIYDFVNTSIKDYKAKKAAELAFLNSFVDGSINNWMPGGSLYDAPRAGDVMFNVLGNMNTVRFLGLEDTNRFPDMVKEFANPEVFHMFGNMPGDDNFSVIPPTIYS